MLLYSKFQERFIKLRKDSGRGGEERADTLRSKAVVMVFVLNGDCRRYFEAFAQHFYLTG